MKSESKQEQIFGMLWIIIGLQADGLGYTVFSIIAFACAALDTADSIRLALKELGIYQRDEAKLNRLRSGK